MRGFLVLVAVLTICSVVGADKSAQDKISDYLEEHVKTDDVEANFAGLESYLAELNQKTHLFGSLRVDLINRILKLKAALHECNWEGFKTYDSVLKTTDYIRGRLGEFIKNADQKHEDICFDELKLGVERQIASMRPGRKAQVDDITDVAIKYIKLNNPGTNVELLKNKKVTTHHKDYYQEILALAMRRHENTKSHKQLSTADLIRQYVVEPCNIYTSFLRPLISGCTRVLEKSPKTDDSFTDNLYRYYVCKSIEEEAQPLIIKIEDTRS